MGGAEVVSTEPAAALMWGISAGGLLEPALRGQELTEATWVAFTQASSSRQWENLKVLETDLAGTEPRDSGCVRRTHQGGQQRDSTMAKGWAGTSSSPVWRGKCRARGCHELLETCDGSLGTWHLSPTKEKAGGGWMSCSTQLLEDECSGQSYQEVAISLLISACVLHTLPKEGPSSRGTLTAFPYGFG